MQKQDKRKNDESLEKYSKNTKKFKKIVPQWWQKGPIYHIYPKSFHDSSGNGIGDLKGKCYYEKSSQFDDILD